MRSPYPFIYLKPEKGTPFGPSVCFNAEMGIPFHAGHYLLPPGLPN